MKMKNHHFNELDYIINTKLNDLGREDIIDKYEKGEFARSDKVKDLQKRFNWDLFIFFVMRDPDLDFIKDDLCSYLTNDHINTALNKICPKVERKY